MITTLKVKRIDNIDLTKYQQEYNSIVRYSFNRYQQNMKQKQIRSLIKELFN